MDHSYYQERLSAFADRELPPDETAAVEAHIADCEECRRRLAELARLEQLVDDASGFDDADYWERSAKKIEARLEGEAATVTDIRPERRSLYAGLWWKLPAIAASVLIVGYIGLHQSDIIEDDIMIPPSSQSAPAQPAESESEPPVSQPTVGDIPSLETDSYQADEAEPESTLPETEATLDTDEDLGEIGRTIETEESKSRRDIPTGILQPKSIKEEGLNVVIPDDGTSRDEIHKAPAQPSAQTDEEVKPVVVDDQGSGVVQRTGRTKQRKPAATSVDQPVASDEMTEQYLEEKSLEVEVSSPPREKLPTDKSRLSGQEYDKVKSAVEESEGRGYVSTGDTRSDADNGLEALRATRDSLQIVLAELSDTTKASTRRSLFGAAGKQGLVPSTTTSLAPKRTSKEAEQVTEKLLDVWYQICRTTKDRKERERGLDFIGELAYDPLSDLNKKAGHYLDSLDTQ